MSTTIPRVAVVTGAGSGIGRAVALRLAREGWLVAVVGRRESALRETATLGTDVQKFSVFPCDLTDPESIKTMCKGVLDLHGRIDALINAAGTNTRRRTLADLAVNEYSEVIATNLNGSLHCVLGFLPAMRGRSAGTIVNINSEAGRVASVKAGAAYVVSKFGLAGLTQYINAEERGNGIRACSIFPGDVNTPLVDRRAVVPTPEQRAKFLQPEDVAEAVWLVVSLPPRAVVEELVLRPA